MEKKVENLRKQMGIPDPKEAKNEKKDVVMPTLGARDQVNNEDKKNDDEN